MAQATAGLRAPFSRASTGVTTMDTALQKTRALATEASKALRAKLIADARGTGNVDQLATAFVMSGGGPYRAETPRIQLLRWAVSGTATLSTTLGALDRDSPRVTPFVSTGRAPKVCVTAGLDLPGRSATCQL